MAQFKSDSYYNTTHYDDFRELLSLSTDSSEEEVLLPADPSRRRRVWKDEHYDVLMELYRAFKSSGESIFGRCFFQFGDFHQFVDLIYENTILPGADLLKTQLLETHVSALGLSARSKHRLSALQTRKDRGALGVGGQGT
jgi:hypothetical protein